MASVLPMPEIVFNNYMDRIRHKRSGALQRCQAMVDEWRQSIPGNVFLKPSVQTNGLTTVENGDGGRIQKSDAWNGQSRGESLELSPAVSRRVPNPDQRMHAFDELTSPPSLRTLESLVEARKSDQSNMHGGTELLSGHRIVLPIDNVESAEHICFLIELAELLRSHCEDDYLHGMDLSLARTCLMELRSANRFSIVLDGNKHDVHEKVKELVEDFIGQQLDWWPLTNTKPRKTDGVVRLKWQCAVSLTPALLSRHVADQGQICGEDCSMLVPRRIAGDLVRLSAAQHSRPSTLAGTQQTGAVPASSQAPVGTAQSASIPLQVMPVQLNVVNQSPYQTQHQPTTIHNVQTAQPRQNLHIFLVVRRFGDLRLAQWEVDGSDDMFFKRLKEEYVKARGWLRFGWYRFSHCEFYKVIDL
jgi:hypothetical protein